jgi:hypothetical protein
LELNLWPVQLPLAGFDPPVLLSGPPAPVLHLAVMDEPAAIIRLRDGFWPACFAWRCLRFDVKAVAAHQSLTRCTWRGREQYHRFRVQTRHSLFDLVHEPASNAWRVAGIANRHPEGSNHEASNAHHRPEKTGGST